MKRQHWNMAAIWSAITAAAVGFAGLVNWSVEMNKKMDTTGTAAAANVQTISVLAQHVQSLERGDIVIKRKLGLRSRRDTLETIPPVKPEPGLLRKFIRLLF